ncbi:MAG: hypothetical protein CMJ52_03825 [Planctomycetaceae bacterium]|nr:hypothetical protein [Planctomycetaceae bacterium]
MIHLCLATLVAFASADVAHQELVVRIDPATNLVEGTSTMTITGGGTLAYRIHPASRIHRVLVDGVEVNPGAEPVLPDLGDGSEVVMHWSGLHREDVAAGERPGRIHNQSVRAHAAEDGVFLSDGSDWHPQPLDHRGRPRLRPMSLSLEAPAGWSLVASGDPEGGPSPEAPCRTWRTPRPVAGMAVAGNRHGRFHRSVDTDHGPVDVVAQLSEANADKAGFYLDAAEDYLVRYTRLLGPYPFERFTVVENFFSSGFAFPGFTLLGPRVVGMAPRSLKPGYLDHELLHAWWGNGVYVDEEDGNWCEGLTNFCTNYGRRVLEEGPEAGRRYRRGIINQVSLDPTLDDGPLGDFGRRGRGVDRFVGYEKGSFVFMMLQDVLEEGLPERPFDQSPIWEMLRDLAANHLGERIGWREIQVAAEAVRPERPKGWLDPFFQRWVREHAVPGTSASLEASPPQSIERLERNGGAEVLVDPDSRHYRTVPIAMTSPTIAGTLGSGVSLEVSDAAPIAPSDLAWTRDVPRGQNPMLIGADAIAANAALIARTSDPIEIDESGFTIDGVRWSEPGHSVLHTMHHPDVPGRYITVFHSNGDAGWPRLRLIWYYRKDTTVVWDGGETLLRRVHEPEAWMKDPRSGAAP